MGDLLERLRGWLACKRGDHDLYPIRVHMLIGGRSDLGIPPSDHWTDGKECRRCTRGWITYKDGSPRPVGKRPKDQLQ